MGRTTLKRWSICRPSSLLATSRRCRGLARWEAENRQEGFTAFSLPVPHRRRLRTANIVERLNEELRRRMRVAELFPNEASYLRSVSAIVMEIAED